MAVTDRDPSFADSTHDDLPRTLRREREARERAGQTLSTQTLSTSPTSASAETGASAFVPEPAAWPASAEAAPAVVTAFDVPFLRLMAFCVKLVFAAIPAMILLGIVLWSLGHLLMTYFPWLVKVQVLIRVPQF